METLDNIKLKIYTWKSLQEQTKIWNFSTKIVFTNGCFDILHLGHIEYLAKAKELGHILIVGLNSDKSVRDLKGDSRPINNQSARATILAALSFIDIVIVFDEETPEKLIKMIKPDVLVKGGDYNPENIIGYDIVKEYGGDVITIHMTDGYSTTNIIKELKKN